MKRENRPVWPFYAAGCAFLVCSLLLPVYALWALLTAAVCSAAAFVICVRACVKKERKGKKEEEKEGGPFATGDEQLDKTLDEARGGLKTLRKLNDAIPDNVLSAQIARMEKSGAAILREVAEHPEKGKQIRRFATYYLPTSIKVLSSYAKMSASGGKGENATGLMEEIKENASMIADAFEKQLDSLYLSEVLDVSSDLDVLKGMMKGDGLVG